MSTKLKVGEIPYLNMFPIFTALKHYFDNSEVEFVIGHPTDLNKKLRENAVDISPSSSIEFARNYQRYHLIPDISISSKEKVNSVILFSPFKLDERSDFVAYATSKSDTSATLLKIIFHKFLGKNVPVVSAENPQEMAGKENEPYLLIGDDAISELIGKNKKTVPFLYDLGSIWKAHTGLPFVFALWIVHAKSYRVKESGIKKFSRKLLDAKKISLNLIRNRNEKMLGKDEYPWGFLNEYWNNLSYDLGRELDGLTKFFELSQDIGEIEDFPQMAFIDLL